MTDTNTTTATEPVYFNVRPGEDDPQLVLHALQGVTDTLFNEELTREMDQSDIDRIANLQTAAFLLSRWLTERLAVAPAERLS